MRFGPSRLSLSPIRLSLGGWARRRWLRRLLALSGRLLVRLTRAHLARRQNNAKGD
jgi:hypothetical protein